MTTQKSWAKQVGEDEIVPDAELQRENTHNAPYPGFVLQEEVTWVPHESQEERLAEEQQARRKMLVAQRRRERRQRVRQRLREKREIEALQERLRKKATGKANAGVSPAKAAKLQEHAEAQQQKEAQGRKRDRRRVRINNTIASLIDAVRATRNDAAAEHFTDGLLAELGNGSGTDGGSVDREAAKIKEITRTLNDHAYMCVQRMRAHGSDTDNEWEGKQEVEGYEDGGDDAAEAQLEALTDLSEGDVMVTVDEGEQGAAHDKSGFIVSAKMAHVHGHNAGGGESPLFSTDDEVDDFLGETFYDDDMEDGSDDEDEVAADIDECLDAYLATAECKSDEDRRSLLEAKKLMRGWLEINERSRSAEIKHLRRNGSKMSAAEREVAKESIKGYDSFVYGGAGGGLLRRKSLDFILGGAGPTTSKGGAQGYSQAFPPMAPRASGQRPARERPCGPHSRLPLLRRQQPRTRLWY
ncbi:hypothetical protein PG991_013609 [Apiospora marii]|uniref:Uncharacterized protein n=1 Tax=Apiospora marii TaxID=335849 RepID=A0ABR1R6N1_9PEZI